MGARLRSGAQRASMSLGLDWVVKPSSLLDRLFRATIWVVIAYISWLMLSRSLEEFKIARQQDLMVYVTAARDLLARNDLYHVYEPFPGPDGLVLPFTYPPAAAVFFIPLAPLPDQLIKWGWVAINIALAIWILRRLFHGQRLWLVLVLILTAPFLRSIYQGQINLVLYSLILLDLLWPRARHVLTHRRSDFGFSKRWGGVLVGIACAIKVTPAWMGLAYLLKRDWPSALRTAAAGIGLTALGFLIAPADSINFWTKLLWDPTRTGIIQTPDNQSLTGLLARWSSDAQPQWWLKAMATAFAIALCCVVAWRWREHASRLEFVTAIGLGAVLISPVSWSHHFIWLVTFVAVLVRHGHTRWATALAVALTFEPLYIAKYVSDWPPAVFAVVVSTYTLCAVVALIYLLRTPAIDQVGTQPAQLTESDTKPGVLTESVASQGQSELGMTESTPEGAPLSSPAQKMSGTRHHVDTA